MKNENQKHDDPRKGETTKEEKKQGERDRSLDSIGDSCSVAKEETTDIDSSTPTRLEKRNHPRLIGPPTNYLVKTKHDDGGETTKK